MASKPSLNRLCSLLWDGRAPLPGQCQTDSRLLLSLSLLSPFPGRHPRLCWSTHYVPSDTFRSAFQMYRLCTCIALTHFALIVQFNLQNVILLSFLNISKSFLKSTADISSPFRYSQWNVFFSLSLTPVFLPFTHPLLNNLSYYFILTSLYKLKAQNCWGTLHVIWLFQSTVDSYSSRHCNCVNAAKKLY